MSTSPELHIVPDLHFCWFASAAGNFPAEKELFAVTQIQAKARMFTTIRRHILGESRKNAVKYLGDGILEFLTQDSGIWLRVLFFTDHPHVVGVKTVVKKRNKSDPDDLKYAKKCRDSWTPTSCCGPARFPGH